MVQAEGFQNIIVNFDLERFQDKKGFKITNIYKITTSLLMKENKNCERFIKEEMIGHVPWRCTE